MSRPRVLLAITGYNGREFFPRTITSAARLLDDTGVDLDILVLDDASPEPGFSDDLARWCADAGVGYYRTPRNLGIPRNVNLGLLRAREGGYDHVIISNSDVMYPAGMVSAMVAVAESDPTIGSVTAWSNNVSVYSLPNEDPDRYLADQDVVDWVSASLAGHYGAASINVPAGISFCILIPRRVIEDVGLMDPAFGRGYCEETDWSLRSRIRGWRVTLAPGVYVYHQGRGSNVGAGLVTGDASTVPENEAIIDHRYPQFRSQVGAFLASDILETAHHDAVERIVGDAARQFGYRVEVSWLAPMSGEHDVVRCMVEPGGNDPIRVQFRGFEHLIATPDPDADLGALIETALGGPPTQIRLGERTEASRRLFARWDQGEPEPYSYPASV